MPIRFQCPCSKKLKTADGTAGKRAKCPECYRTLIVPASESYDTLAAEATQTVEKPPEAEHKPGGHDTRTVLVADSTKKDRERTSELLRQHGFEVIQAGDGTAALDMIRHFHPLAAVINVQLDVLSGFQVVQQLRALTNQMNKDVFDTPVIITAEKLHGRDKQYAIHLGVEDCYTKPVPKDICGKLDKVIAHYHPHVQ